LAAAVAVLLLGSSVSAFGQSLAPTSSTGQAQAASATTARRLSVMDAVQLALEQNLGLQVQRIDPQVQDLSISQVRTSWTPTFGTTVSNSSANQPISSFLSGASGQLTNGSFRANVQASQLLPWGGDYSIGWNNSRGTTNSVFSSPNPQLQSSLNFNYTQPLIRNFKIDAVRQQLRLAQLTREDSDVQLRQAILQTSRSVRYAYWNMAYSIASLGVARQSLELAQQSLKDNRARVEIGTMAPIDVVSAEAEAAQREQAVILAEANVQTAEDNLRTLIYDPNTPDFWNIRIELTDQPVFQARTVDLDGAVRTALEKRTDLIQAKKSLEMSDVNIRYFRNQIMPDVSLQASYGMTGQGGLEKKFGPGFPPEVIGELNTSYGSVLKQVLGNDFPNWSVGVTVSYPIGTSAAEANLARAKLQYTQSQIQYRSAELQVVTQVRSVVRNVNTSLKTVAATRAARELAEKRLEAEQKKFAAGMSTSFLVFQAQRDLASARSDELNAILSYNDALIDYETVQEAPVGSGVGVSVAGSGSGAVSTPTGAGSVGGISGVTSTAASRSPGGM
jgi:outer membrane protein